MTTTPSLTRMQNIKGIIVVIALIILWAIGALITRNGDWLDKHLEALR